MNKYTAAALLISALAFGGCGGGGGGGTPIIIPQVPATKAVTTVYLFGNMSANSRVAAVQSIVTVPSGVLVNYSSPAPAGFSTDPNTYPLRHGFVVPSGVTKVADADISGNYNTATGKLTISLENSARLDIKSSSVGKGTEIARIIYKLPTAGVIPTTIPANWQDPDVTVWQEFSRPPNLDVVNYSGLMLNFVPSYE